MNKQELTKILKQHKLWLKGDGGDRADLSCADLRSADLRDADLRGADLSGADLRDADLRGANLSSANLRDADLSYTDLSYTNLSGVIGLLDPTAWVKENFEISSAGIIVYKAFGTGLYDPPNRWEIAEGSYITEVCNSCRADTCGCGVNFGTMKWIHNNIKNPSSVWKCLIEWIDLVSVVVPYNTDGKARCERLRLVERITDDL